MNAIHGRNAAAIILVGSLALLVVTVALPEVKMPETATYQVPSPGPAAGTYQIEFYQIPPVDSNVLVNVTFTQFVPNAVEFAFSPVQGDTVFPALAHGSLGSGGRFSFITSINRTTEFRLFVIAYNGTGCTVRISSVWSPYYDVRVYTAPAVFLILASGLAMYYFWQRIPQQREEDKVMEELREAETQNQTAGRLDRKTANA